MELGRVFTDELIVGDRMRHVDESKVATLAESMKAIGLQQPISVWAGDDDRPILIAGRHRLAAAAKLGWEQIDCLYVTLNEIDRQIWEIDENLARSELTPAEIAGHMAQRKRLWERREVPQVAAPRPQHQKQFAADTAEKTGRSKDTIQRSVTRGERIAPDVLQAVQGTDRDKGVVLDRLAKMTPTEQRAEIAKPIAPPPAEPLNDIEISNKTRRRLAAAWNSAPPSDREWFRDWIDTPNAKWTGRSAA